MKNAAGPCPAALGFCIRHGPADRPPRGSSVQLMGASGQT